MENDSRDFSCFSVRRLNPFLGVVQIVQTSDSRAISVSGIDWEIQILAERPNDTWGAPSPVKPKRQFLRFGVWNRIDGLTGVPANPLLNLTQMIKAADRIIEILVIESERIPFPVNDKTELWLLDDKDQMPLALLASSTEATSISSHVVARWICSNKEFPSLQLHRQSKIQPESVNPNPNKSYLETIVHRRARQNVQRWFKRDVDGGGSSLICVSEHQSAAETRRLPAEAFPSLLLNSAWNDPLPQAVVSDYHAWLSPYLLTLQSLPDDLRVTLERKAVEQALAVNACWRLYPKIIDRKMIDTARVEARLRRSRSKQ